jgi:hypothetical protein
MDHLQWWAVGGLRTRRLARQRPRGHVHGVEGSRHEPTPLAVVEPRSDLQHVGAVRPARVLCDGQPPAVDSRHDGRGGTDWRATANAHHNVRFAVAFLLLMLATSPLRLSPFAVLQRLLASSSRRRPLAPAGLQAMHMGRYNRLTILCRSALLTSQVRPWPTHGTRRRRCTSGAWSSSSRWCSPASSATSAMLSSRHPHARARWQWQWRWCGAPWVASRFTRMRERSRGRMGRA